MESRQEVLREAEGSAVGSYIRSREGGGGIWHRRGALEFRRFDEVRRDLGLELRRGDALAAAAPRGEHVDDRVTLTAAAVPMPRAGLKLEPRGSAIERLAFAGRLPS